jgi:hypothetical protein
MGSSEQPPPHMPWEVSEASWFFGLFVCAPWLAPFQTSVASLSAGVKCIPRSASARPTSCPRHVDKQDYNQNAKWVSISAPALRRFRLRPINPKMHCVSIGAADKNEGDHDRLGH